MPEDDPVANTLEIPCAGCGALYRMLTRSTDLSVLFRCVHCQEHNLHHVGRTMLLNAHIMTSGTDEKRREHVRQRMEDSVLEALADVRRRLDRLVNINVDVSFAARLDPPGLEAVSQDGHEAPLETPAAREDERGDRERPVGGFADTTEPRPITDDDLRTLREALNAPGEFWNRLSGA